MPPADHEGTPALEENRREICKKRSLDMPARVSSGQGNERDWSVPIQVAHITCPIASLLLTVAV